MNDNNFNQKFIQIAKNIVDEFALEFSKEKKFSDSFLRKLSETFGAVFERALELYELGRVTKIIAFDRNQRTISKETYESRWLIQVKGLSGECYTLFPGINFCPCQAFKYQLLGYRH